MKTNDLITVTAKIIVRTPEEGGRKFGIHSGYRPDHVFEMPEDLRNMKAYFGVILFEDYEVIEPGETKVAKVEFFKRPEMEKFIKVGQKWYINEAAQTVGYGEILEIDSNLQS